MTLSIAEPIGPRPRNAARTTEAILRAAQRLFATRGYTTTGVREIAAEAGVNSTLVRRYFGSKEGLLRAAVEDVLIVEPFIAGSRENFGARAVATLRLGDEHPSSLAMMLLSTADPRARALCGELMHERIITPLAAWLGGPLALVRARQINMLWIGFMTMRQVLGLQALNEDESNTFLWLQHAVQAIVDESA